MARLLGIDIGTSGTKTVLFDEYGSTIASATVEYPLSQPRIGWAEQDPEDWWRAAAQTIAQVLEKSGTRGDEVTGVGLSGQMHGMVLLGADNEVLRPAIIWCDQRTQKQCDDITRIIGRQRLIEITANPAITGFTASKIMWVKEHQPEIYEKIHKILLPKDYIRFRLTGEFATEVSDASGMQLLDVPNRCWSREVLSKLEIPYEWMADVYESAVVSAKVDARGARETGLAVGVPVVGGGGDQAAGAVGNGIVRQGIVSATIGSSGVVFAHTDNIAIDPQGRVHTFCHAVPGAWHIMGVTQGAGISLKWLRDQFMGQERDIAASMQIDPYDLMNQEAALAAPGCDGLIFLPYMMGERTPHLDADAKGVFFGLTAAHTRRDVIRAVMEGVSYSLLDCMNIIRQMGCQAQVVRASGGGARSALWRQMLADMFRTDVATIQSAEGPALGAALLAGVGTGVYDSVPQACEQVIVQNAAQKPEEAAADAYAAFYPIYTALYPALRDSYRSVAQVLAR
jgi:xylulokinase